MHSSYSFVANENVAQLSKLSVWEILRKSNIRLLSRQETPTINPPVIMKTTFNLNNSLHTDHFQLITQIFCSNLRHLIPRPPITFISHRCSRLSTEIQDNSLIGRYSNSIDYPRMDYCCSAPILLCLLPSLIWPFSNSR